MKQLLLPDSDHAFPRNRPATRTASSWGVDDLNFAGIPPVNDVINKSDQHRPANQVA